MSIPYLLLAINSIKIIFTLLHDNNKITNKNTIGFNELGNILDTFQHRDDIIKTQKNIDIAKQFQICLGILIYHLFLKHLNHQGFIFSQKLLSKRKYENPTCFHVTKDLKAFMFQKLNPLLCPKHI